MTTRRELLRHLGAGAASASALGAGKTALATHHATLQAFARPSRAAPWWLFKPLQQGSRVGLGWRIQDLGAVERGAAILELSHDKAGVTARVHICTYEDQPRGLAHTELFDLILMDGGQGDKPTEESIGRVLLTLADIIRENELGEEADLDRVNRMLSHSERVAIYGPETLT